jgi:hypothetical protein
MADFRRSVPARLLGILPSGLSFITIDLNFAK